MRAGFTVAAPFSARRAWLSTGYTASRARMTEPSGRWATSAWPGANDIVPSTASCRTGSYVSWGGSTSVATVRYGVTSSGHSTVGVLDRRPLLLHGQLHLHVVPRLVGAEKLPRGRPQPVLVCRVEPRPGQRPEGVGGRNDADLGRVLAVPERGLRVIGLGRRVELRVPVHVEHAGI